MQFDPSRQPVFLFFAYWGSKGCELRWIGLIRIHREETSIKKSQDVPLAVRTTDVGMV